LAPRKTGCFLRLPLVVAIRREVQKNKIFYFFSYSLTLRGKPRAFGKSPFAHSLPCRKE
jgi:hypothetical protein